MRKWLSGWRARHQHRLSLCLHAVGIPLAIGAVLLAGWQLWQWRWDLWWRPVLLLATGYALQWIGHRIEGNQMGELAFLRRLLGRSSVTGGA